MKSVIKSPPIELVRWAEPLFGFGEGKATGFSEKTVAAYESAVGIRLPEALWEYYLACGRASLNCALKCDVFRLVCEWNIAKQSELCPDCFLHNPNERTSGYQQKAAWIKSTQTTICAKRTSALQKKFKHHVSSELHINLLVPDDFLGTIDNAVHGFNPTPLRLPL